MSRNVNITTTGWQALGTTASCPQFQMSVAFQWTDDAGVPHTTAPTLVTFPDVIGQMTAGEKAILAEAMKDVVLLIARTRAGVDP